MAMWTLKTRGRAAGLSEKLRHYPTAMTAEEWSFSATAAASLVGTPCRLSPVQRVSAWFSDTWQS
jgi:hypothetical protein